MKLLLVEDDEKIAAAVKRGLEAEGFHVEVANDGDEGFWRATESAYDLVLLDILLPRRNGFRVCADLRAAGVWTPILVLTAKDGDLDLAEALDTGADDVLVKPFSFVVLVARIRALLRRAAGAPARPVRRGRSADRRRGARRCAERRRGSPHRPRVRRAGVPGPSGRTDPEQGRHPRRGLAGRVRRRSEHRRGLRRPVATQGRRAVRPPDDRDRPGSGLPARRRREPSPPTSFWLSRPWDQTRPRRPRDGATG